MNRELPVVDGAALIHPTVLFRVILVWVLLVMSLIVGRRVDQRSVIHRYRNNECY